MDKRLLGLALDTSYTLPLAINQISSLNFSCFHFAQNIPLDPDLTPPLELLDLTDTDAALHLTLYPKLGLSVVGDGDLRDLVDQVAQLNARGRRVYLRFAPGNLLKHSPSRL